MFAFRSVCLGEPEEELVILEDVSVVRSRRDLISVFDDAVAADLCLSKRC